MPGRGHENVRGRDDPSLSVDPGGVDELGVIPWPILLRRRIARRIGLDPRWAVMWVVLGGLFTVSFTITILVVSLDGIADDLHSSTGTVAAFAFGIAFAFGFTFNAFRGRRNEHDGVT